MSKVQMDPISEHLVMNTCYTSEEDLGDSD